MFEKIKNLFKRKNKGSEEKMQKNELEQIIYNFLHSEKRQHMKKGNEYYLGLHDIKDKKRIVVGEDGKPVESPILVNNKIIDNQYSKLVEQKVNYLFGKPFLLKTKNEKYKKILNRAFKKQINQLAVFCLNNGVGWVYPYYDNNGELKFKMFKGEEIIPVYNDYENLERVIRVYEKPKPLKRYVWNDIYIVEVYDKNGLSKYEYEHGSLKIIEENISYISIGDKKYNWERIPFIKFKYNDIEQPLIMRVKSLQDAINTILSNFMDNMTEDLRNTILVLVNYDGENIEEFRRNLTASGIIKTNTVDGVAGDVRTLKMEVNKDNYQTVLSILKKAITDNGRGFDAKDDRLSSNPNEMNIQSMYADIDLDANQMEMEFQSSFEELLWFVNTHLGIDEEVEIIFNRDILINEAQTIANCVSSIGILSQETILEMHPWIENSQEELKRIKKEEEANINKSDIPFGDKDEQKEE